MCVCACVHVYVIKKLCVILGICNYNYAIIKAEERQNNYVKTQSVLVTLFVDAYFVFNIKPKNLQVCLCEIM